MIFFGYNTKILKLKTDYHVRFYSSSFISEDKKVKVFIRCAVKPLALAGG